MGTLDQEFQKDGNILQSRKGRTESFSGTLGEKDVG